MRLMAGGKGCIPPLAIFTTLFLMHDDMTMMLLNKMKIMRIIEMVTMLLLMKNIERKNEIEIEKWKDEQMSIYEVQCTHCSASAEEPGCIYLEGETVRI